MTQNEAKKKGSTQTGKSALGKHPDAAADKKLIRQMVKPSALKGGRK